MTEHDLGSTEERASMTTTIGPRATRHVAPRSRRRSLGRLVTTVAISLGLALTTAPARAEDEETGTITGRVIDTAGQPISGITVDANRIVSFTHSSWTEYSGADGTFTIEVPEATGRLAYWLTFRDERSGKVYANHWIGDEDSTHAVGADAPWAVGDVTLTRLASISGTVARPDGTPVKSVWVTAGVAGQPATDTSIRTAANGSYTLRVAPGATYTLRAYLSGTWGSASVTASPEVEDQAVTGIDLVVTSASCPDLRAGLTAARSAHTRAQQAKSAADKAVKVAQQQAAKAKTKLTKAKKKLKKAKKTHKPSAKVAKLKAKATKAKSKAETAAATAVSSTTAARKAAAALTQATSALARAQADVAAKCLPE